MLSSTFPRLATRGLTSPSSVARQTGLASTRLISSSLLLPRHGLSRTPSVPPAFPQRHLFTGLNPLQRRQRPLRSHPSAEPLSESDLVNPSGRIYSADMRSHLDPEVAEELWVRQFDFIRRPPPVLGPILFSLLVGGAAYAYLAFDSADETDDLVREIKSTSWDLSSWIGSASLGLGGGDSRAGGLSERKIREAATLKEAERAGLRLEAIQSWTQGWGEVSTFLQRSYTGFAEWYLNLSPHKSATLPIIAINAFVFLLWKVPTPGLQAFMRTHFLHRPSSGRSYTLLTSTFSHQSFVHFAMNNLALYSIGASGMLTKGFLFDPEDARTLNHSAESSSAQHFGAMFVAAGLASALGSHLFTAVAWRRALARNGGGLGPEVTKLNRRSSLGASGAIYSALVMSAMGLPDARVSLIFLPFISFPISYGVGSMVALDTLGAIRGWALFDHVAHLSGAAFGAAYFARGNEVWERMKGVRREMRERERNERGRGDRPSLGLLGGDRV